jgi:hypothetical protein
MWDFIFDNTLSSLALLIMFFSIALQFSYLKFKRKSVNAKGTLESITKKKFWNEIKIQFNLEDEVMHGKLISFKKKFKVGTDVDIIYNPNQILKGDNSIVLTPLFKKLKLKSDQDFNILLKEQSPSLLHLGLIIFGLILLTL